MPSNYLRGNSNAESREVKKVRERGAVDRENRKQQAATRQLETRLATADRAEELLGEIRALERQVARPITVIAKPPKKSEPKTVKLPKNADFAAFGLIAEMYRRHNKTPIEETLRKALPGDENRLIRKMAKVFLKGSTDPMNSTDAAAGAELVENAVGAFYSDLASVSVFAALQDHAPSFTFGRFANVTIPQRAANAKGSMKPAWVAEGATIPVLEDTMGSSYISRYKLAGISTYSDELLRTSIPSIASVVRSSFLEDAATGVDEYLLDDVAPIAGLRPGGLLNGAPNQASAGNTPANIAADLAFLRSEMIKVKARKPVLIMNTLRANGLEMLFDGASGTFPFAAMIQNNNLFGIPLIVSDTVPEDQVIMTDAATLMLARDMPEFVASQSVTLAMADADGVDPTMAAAGTTSDAVDDPGSIHISDAAGTTPATEVRSMFQTAATAMRFVLPVSWGEIRKGTAYLTGVAW